MWRVAAPKPHDHEELVGPHRHLATPSGGGPAFETTPARPRPLAGWRATFRAMWYLVARDVGPHRALDLLAEPAGVADIEFVAPKTTDVAWPAAFE